MSYNELQWDLTFSQCERTSAMRQCHPGHRNLQEATPLSYGDETLEAFFAKAVKEGLKGQELGDQAVFGVNEE
eukprot:1147254-Pelagomonas_calceolata.AAC.2